MRDLVPAYTSVAVRKSTWGFINSPRRVLIVLPVLLSPVFLSVIGVGVSATLQNRRTAKSSKWSSAWASAPPFKTPFVYFAYFVVKNILVPSAKYAGQTVAVGKRLFASLNLEL